MVRGGSQTLGTTRTELEGVVVPAGDLRRKVAIITETNQQLVLGHLDEKRLSKLEGVFERRLVQRRPAWGTLCMWAGTRPALSRGEVLGNRQDVGLKDSGRSIASPGLMNEEE